MRRTTLVVTTVLAFAACSGTSESHASRCGAAFDHMTEVSEKEFASLAREKPEMAKELEEEAKANDPARRSEFLRRCKAGDIDVDCIMKTTDTMAYFDCLASAKP